MSYEEEDTCHMRRRINVLVGGNHAHLGSYEEEDTCMSLVATMRTFRPPEHLTSPLVSPWP